MSNDQHSVEAFKAPSMFMGDNWCARCVVCGFVLTKYDETAEQARQFAEAAKRKGECRCGN